MTDTLQIKGPLAAAEAEADLAMQMAVNLIEQAEAMRARAKKAQAEAAKHRRLAEFLREHGWEDEG